MPPKRLLLFDVAAAAFRSHFAMKNNPLRRRSDQRPTSALNGYCNYLLAMLKLVRPTHVVAALESNIPTFRHRTYPLYKAQRTPPPPELTWQLQHIGDLSRSLGIAPVRFDGFEADDIIGSLTHRAQADGFDHVHIFSHDKDFMQLLNDRVSLHRPVSGGAVELITPGEVERAHSGVTPSQFIDYLSLTGDAVDNIPGVEGVGPVSASKLLVAHGSVRGILRACLRAEPAFASEPLVGGVIASAASRAATDKRGRPRKAATAVPATNTEQAVAVASASASATATASTTGSVASVSVVADSAVAVAAQPTAPTGVSAETRAGVERDWASIVAEATSAATSGGGGGASASATFKFRTKTTARAILQHRYQLLLNQTLAAIRTDVAPLPAWDELRWNGVPSTATPALHHFDLYSAANRFAALAAHEADIAAGGSGVAAAKPAAAKPRPKPSHMQLLSDLPPPTPADTEVASASASASATA